MNQWAITIGINHYSFLQPLRCARQDAQSWQQFLIESAGFPASRCLLMTDTSPAIGGQSTVPTRAKLLAALHGLRQRVQPGDRVWWFFSGYGISDRGQDYLIPIDGNPATLQETCIPLAQIYQAFQQMAAECWVILDISRSQSSLFNASIGTQAVHLARQAAIPTLLSCQPGQFSRETSTLRHSLFMVGLLEGLRYAQPLTLASLEQFLAKRLPELGDHHLQPVQQPLVIAPASQRQRHLLPAIASPNSEPPPQPVSQAWVADRVPVPMAVASRGHEANGRPRWNHPASAMNGHLQATAIQPTRSLSSTHSSPPEHGIVSMSNGHQNGKASSTAPTVVAVAQEPRAIAEAQHRSVPPTQPPLPVTVMSSSHAPEPSTRSQPEPPMTQASNSQLSADLDTANPEVSEESEAALDANFWRPLLLWGGLASILLSGWIIWKNWAAIPKAVVPDPGGSPTVPDPTASIPVSPDPAVVPVNPPGDTTETATSFTGQPSPPSSPVVPPVVQPSRLAEARSFLKLNQASPYSKAIETASLIPIGHPEYQEAQREITRWSQRILEIADERAQQNQYDTAVLASILVPTSQGELYAQAQSKLAQWCGLLNPNSRSSTQQQARVFCPK